MWLTIVGLEFIGYIHSPECWWLQYSIRKCQEIDYKVAFFLWKTWGSDVEAKRQKKHSCLLYLCTASHTSCALRLFLCEPLVVRWGHRTHQGSAFRCSFWSRAWATTLGFPRLKRTLPSRAKQFLTSPLGEFWKSSRCTRALVNQGYWISIANPPTNVFN